MRVQLHTETIKSFKTVKKESGGTTTFETESCKNQAILADFYTDDGKVPTRHLSATAKKDVTDFTDEVKLVIEGVDGLDINHLEIESS